MPRDALVTKHVGWTVVSGATSYIVEVDGSLYGDPVAASPMDILVVENTTVPVRVAGVNDGGTGGYSASVNAVAGNAAPPPVNNLQVGSVSQGRITISWDYDDPPTDFAQFDVTHNAGIGGGIIFTVDQTNKTAALSGLPDSLNVTFTVRARDSGGLQSTAVQIAQTTPPPPVVNAPGVPTALRTTRIGYSSADLAWNLGSGATHSQYSGDGTNWSGLYTGTTYKWGGLAEKHRYSFFVRSYNSTTGLVSGTVGVAFDTLPKVKSTTPNYQNRLYGYQQPYAYSGVGFSHYASGVSGSTDNWAGQSNTLNFLYALDNNLQSGPFSLQGYRWVTLATTLNYDALNAVYGVWGYQGTFQWDAWDTSGVLVQTGRMTGGGTNALIGVGPNILNKLTGKRIARIRWYFYAWGASPGYYKLSELAINARVITGYTTVYNPA